MSRFLHDLEAEGPLVYSDPNAERVLLLGQRLLNPVVTCGTESKTNLVYGTCRTGCLPVCCCNKGFKTNLAGIFL